MRSWRGSRGMAWCRFTCGANSGIPQGPRRLLREYIEAGRLGKKSGGGFYDAEDDGRP